MVGFLAGALVLILVVIFGYVAVDEATGDDGLAFLVALVLLLLAAIVAASGRLRPPWGR